ncbi:MAG: hypothetical protein KIS92_11655 [Planctomycetota bacterium]|nr:hypothetical protein [Planctomycetota bacterium]
MKKHPIPAVGLIAALLAGGAAALDIPAYDPKDETVLLLHADGSAENAAPGAKASEAKAAYREEGVRGKAVDLSQSEKIVYAPVAADAFANGFTVDAWVLLARVEQTTQFTLLRQPGVFSCEIKSEPNEYARAVLTIRVGKEEVEARSDNALPYGVWFHLAFVYAPKDGLSIRINGSDASEVGGYQTRKEAKGALEKGEARIELPGGVPAVLDEVRVSAAALGADQCHGVWSSGRRGDFLPFTPQVATKPLTGAGENLATAIAVEAVPTFESIGLYVKYHGDANQNATCRVRYRAKGSEAWKDGLDPFAERADHEFRGSLVLLNPATAYEIEVKVADPDGNVPTAMLETRTWSDERPVGKTVELPEISKETLVIKDVGSPDAWVLYAPAPGKQARIEVDGPNAVRIDSAAYVILRGVTITGGTRSAVDVRFSNHVVVERCDLSGYGVMGKPDKDGRFVDEAGKLINYRGGVNVGLQSAQVVVQHCWMHDPAGTTNNWQTGHPLGMEGMVLANTFGNHVIRWNEMIGSEGHRWNDAIESIENGAVNGGPYRDTDIYGNCFAFCNDDGVELDGGQINVRFWDNRIERALCGLSCAPCRSGPAYIFRNLFANLGDERGSAGSAFKMGGGPMHSTGLNVILHNTIDTKGGGLNSVGFGSGAERGGYRAFCRNNAFSGPPQYPDVRDTTLNKLSSFDFDLMGRAGPAVAEGNEAHGVRAVPKYLDAPAGDYRLAADSPGVDAGVPLPNFNDGFAGKAPDMGAFETGMEPGIPHRPTGVAASPSRLVIKGLLEKDQGSGDVKLLMPKRAGAKWQARANVSWLACEPASGETSADALTVKVVADLKGRAPGNYPAAVTFRSNDGYATTVMVNLFAFHTPVVKEVEAEACAPAAPFTTVKDEQASGGAYVTAPEDAKGDGALAWTFTLEKEGTYYISGRCQSPEPPGVHDSFQFKLDDGEKDIWDLNSGTAWNWYGLKGRKDEGRGLKLAAGKHTLYLYVRERDTRIDALRISNNPFEVEP